MLVKPFSPKLKPYENVFSVEWIAARFVFFIPRGLCGKEASHFAVPDFGKIIVPAVSDFWIGTFLSTCVDQLLVNSGTGVVGMETRQPTKRLFEREVALAKIDYAVGLIWDVLELE